MPCESWNNCTVEVPPDQQQFSRRHRVGARHADMSVDAALRERRPVRQAKMRGRFRRKPLDRRADREDRLGQLVGEVGNAELGVEIIDEPAFDGIIVPFAGRVHAW